MLILDMIEVLPPLGKYKYDTSRILSMKCYIDNSVHLWSCIRNINSHETLIDAWPPESRGRSCHVVTMHALLHATTCSTPRSSRTGVAPRWASPCIPRLPTVLPGSRAPLFYWTVKRLGL
jgi:hypothetical protein